MLIKIGIRWYIFLITIIILMFTCPLVVKNSAEIAVVGYEEPIYSNNVPIYKIAILESTQREIWKLCEEHRFSYELALAVFQIEGNNNTQINNIKEEIEELVYFRDYWTEQGFPDEFVFDLLLLSRQRGIEGCIIFMKDNDSYYLDSYVQKVTEYKYYLEQIDDGEKA